MASEPPTTVDAEAAELGNAHLARWLDELLPSGPTVVVGGGLVLASVLATDRRRPVLLVEPRPAALEAAARRPQAGVLVAGDPPGDDQRFASGVLVGPDAPRSLVRLLDGPLCEAVVAVVTDRAGAAAASATLDGSGRSSTTAELHVRLASTIGIGDGSAPARSLGSAPDEPVASIVLSGLDASPSVLVGADAGPSRWWTDVEWLRRSLRAVDSELRADATVRIDELEQQIAHGTRQTQALEAHVDGLQRRIDDLQRSTSWRVSAPLRWVSDRARRG